MEQIALVQKPQEDAKDVKLKWLTAGIAGLVFLLIASPFMFKLVNSLVSFAGISTASASGCPTQAGLLLHAVVFFLITRALMEIDFYSML